MAAVWLILGILLIQIGNALERFSRKNSSPYSKPQRWSFSRGRVAGHAGPPARSFRGRAGRLEWWSATLWNGVMSAIIGLIPVIGSLLSLPWIIGNLAVTTRRLHDLKQSAWMQIVPMAIGGVALSVMLGTDAHHQFQLNDLLAMDTPVEKARAGLAVLTVILSIAFSAWLGFAPGTKGPNCYGEADPV